MTTYTIKVEVDEYYLLEDYQSFKQGQKVNVYSGGKSKSIQVGDGAAIIKLGYCQADAPTGEILCADDFLKNAKIGTFEELREHKLNSLID
jgi:hypothetical protein